MDDKSSLMAILEAIEWLVKQAYQPERTIYLAFGHDEETGGHNGAAKIAAQLQARRLQFEYVLDEGGNILSGLLKNVSALVALIGIAEKGYLSLALTAETVGGHSAIPPTDSAIGKLSFALAALSSNPFPSRLPEPTRQMLEYLGPHMAWPERFLLANLWLFEPVIRRQLERSPLTNAAIRTTLAPTLITGGIQENVLPSKARAVVNLRLLPGDNTTAVIEQVRKIIADNAITTAPLPTRVEPSPVTPLSSAAFQTLQRTVREIIPEAIVAPGLLVATTDSRHYAALSKNVFRFFPITLRPGDTERYHGSDERISVEDYARAVRFYVQLIRNSQSSGK
jgi:carboxypeptidase PM20D1